MSRDVKGFDLMKGGERRSQVIVDAAKRYCAAKASDAVAWKERRLMEAYPVL